jgi:hypothetical protein
MQKVYSIDIFAVDGYTTIEISDTKMIVEYDGYDEIVKEEYDVAWETVNKINFMSFYYNGKFMDRKNISHGRKKYIVFQGSYFLMFYNSQNRIEYYLEGGKGPMNSSSISDVTAGSELQEGNIIYSVNNLFNVNELKPWVEGVNGDGVGEKIRIEIKSDWRRFSRIHFLAISNGFVDYNRPYLYDSNNRIKKIRIRNLENLDEYQDFDVLDLPNIQTVVMNFLSWNIEIEILETYQGIKYNDTCINFIIPIAY